MASFFLVVATGSFAQDDNALIDDSPKQGTEAAGGNPQRSKRKLNLSGGRRQNEGDDSTQLQPRQNVDLIDDLSPEQKDAAERNAARKNEKAIPDNLADALARALHSSPGILVADAKLRQAQAELNEVRLGVVQELTLAFQRRASNKVALAQHDAAVKAARATPLAGTNLQQAIMEDEAKILYLLGVGAEQVAEAPQGSANLRAGTGAVGASGGGGMMQNMMRGMGGMGGMTPMGGGMRGMAPGGGLGMGPMGGGMMGSGMATMGGGQAAQKDGEARLSGLPENVRGFLNKRVDVDFTDTPLAEVLEYLQVAGDGASFIVQSPEAWKPDSDGERKAVTLSLKQVTLRSVLQALADLHHCAFVFRDYGILVLGPNVEDEDQFHSFKATGTPMIAPPLAAPTGGGFGMGGLGLGGGGMGGGGMGPGGMGPSGMGPSGGAGGGAPIAPATAAEKPSEQ